MSAPFQPGDVVVYVGKCRHRGKTNPRPFRVGSVHRVIEVAHEANWPAPAIMVPAAFWWIYADCFRKIDDEVTEDFRQQMRSLSAPAKKPVEVGE